MLSFRRQRAAQPPPAPVIADGFTADRWALKLPGAEGVEVRIAAGDGAEASEETDRVVTEVVEACCSAMQIPTAACRVVRTSRLASGEYEVAVVGIVRLAGSAETTWSQWWLQHPAAGAEGRTGLAPVEIPTSASAGPAVQVARAVEEVLWDDPGLLLAGAGGAQVLSELSHQAPLGDAASWASVLRDLAARRVPLPGPGELAYAFREVETSDAVERVERAACHLRSYAIEVRLGEQLHESLALGPDEYLQTTLLPAMHDALFAELGVGFPEIRFQLADDLPAHSYELVVNGSPRAHGTVPPDRVLVDLTPEQLSSDTGFVNPATGGLCTWVERAAVTGIDGQPAIWEPEGVLTRHLDAVLREAASEFADLAWTQQMLDRLNDDPEEQALVEAVNRRYSTESIATVLRLLVEEGVGVRDLDGVLQAMLDHQSPSPGTNGTASRNGSVADVVAAAAHVRRRLAPRLSHTASHRTEWSDEPALRRAKKHVPAIYLGEAEERDLEAVASGQAREAAYGFSDAGSLLRRLRLELNGWENPAPPALITTPSVRPQVRRLIAAQFPRVAVLARDELSSDVEVDQVGLVTLR